MMIGIELRHYPMESNSCLILTLVMRSSQHASASTVQRLGDGYKKTQASRSP